MEITDHIKSIAQKAEGSKLTRAKFEVPYKSTLLKIMKNKLPFLTPGAVGQLCEQFPLTGG
jgi:hypothetical protein